MIRKQQLLLPKTRSKTMQNCFQCSFADSYRRNLRAQSPIFNYFDKILYTIVLVFSTSTVSTPSTNSILLNFTTSYSADNTIDTLDNYSIIKIQFAKSPFIFLFRIFKTAILKIQYVAFYNVQNYLSLNSFHPFSYVRILKNNTTDDWKRLYLLKNVAITYRR